MTNPPRRFTLEPHRSDSPRPPPSSFAFPFQAHPGNPDPGMSIPSPYFRRSSLESLSSSPVRQNYPRDETQPSSGRLVRRSSSFSSLPPPNAPFMNSAGTPTSSSSDTLPRSPSSNDLYRTSAAAALSSPIPRNTSTHSFRTPFLSPSSRPASSLWSPPTFPTYNHDSAASSSQLAPISKTKPPLPSTRLTAPLTTEDKPWLLEREPRTYRSYALSLFFIFLGALGAAALCYFGYSDIVLLDESRLCMVMDENFDTGSLNEDNWNREIQLGGFGNNEFQMTTGFDDNLFFRNNQLYIQPTLSTNRIDNILDQANYTIPDCTTAQTNRTACSAVANAQLGRVINPAMSARINTLGKKSIKYGKVEVRAKLPRGDWLWPAIWMLPVDNAYGPWPMSGEIDILEARGNSPEYPAQGRNYVRSSLNYGPMPALYTQIYGWQSLKRSSYDQGFHTYTFEWTQDFMRMWVDKKLRNMLEVTKIDTEKKGFWSRGHYPVTAKNGSAEVVVQDIWSANGGGRNAPFDQSFYLIVNLAVGGTSGWFPDNKGGKPWYDGSLSAMRDFARNQDTWSKTWPENEDDRSFRLDYIKMWEQCR